MVCNALIGIMASLKRYLLNVFLGIVKIGKTILVKIVFFGAKRI
jgi:hypothetical protein